MYIWGLDQISVIKIFNETHASEYLVDQYSKKGYNSKNMLTRKHILDLLVPLLRAGRYHLFANDYYDRQESKTVIKISYDLAAYFYKQNCLE